uniref:class I SAM-dependent methyltransferase n=1 Tax=Nocardia farcinica TaxID=37329 RepID=UPI003CC7EDBB
MDNQGERIPSKWEEITAADPTHSRRYVERFRNLAAEGHDIVGEARLIDAMLPRGGRVLDAGCGPGRLGGYLYAVGHTVVGGGLGPGRIAAPAGARTGPTRQGGLGPSRRAPGPTSSSASGARW